MSRAPAPYQGGRTRWPRPRDLPVFVVPLAVGVFQVVGCTGAAQYGAEQRGQVGTDLDPLGYGLLVAGPVALLARRRRPVPVLVAVLVATVSYYLLGYPYGPAFAALAVAFVAAVAAGRRAAAWIAAGAGYAAYNGLAYPDWTAAPAPTLTHAGGMLAWGLVVLTGAEIVRVRSERAAEAERIRVEEERRRASEERLAIARELHDVLAHNISMINVQAGVALHLMDEQPEQARSALTAIKEASKEALTEVRSVLGVLRQVDEDVPRTPAAGLERLDDLLGRARAAGLTVRTRIEGTRRPLPAGTDRAAFRIVQESLTNVTRHAGPGPVTAGITIVYGDRDITVQVDDDGVGGAPSAGGNGISGMRERASALGGELTAGPRPGGGFRVRARLPLDGSERTARQEPRAGERARPSSEEET